MSASVAPDPWAVAAHDPPAPSPDKPPDGQMWAHAAQAIAVHVAQSADGIKATTDRDARFGHRSRPREDGGWTEKD